MGKIIGSKRTEKGVLLEIEVGFEEATILRGYYDGVYVFTDQVNDYETHVSTRGRNSSTKYFLIPKHLRRDLDFSGAVSCQKIDAGDKVYFVYALDK